MQSKPMFQEHRLAYDSMLDHFNRIVIVPIDNQAYVIVAHFL